MGGGLLSEGFFVIYMYLEGSFSRMVAYLQFFFTGNHTTSGCAPGWYKANRMCHLFYFQSAVRWSDARTVCHLLGADLAVVNDVLAMEALANQRREIKLDYRVLYLGLSGQLNWIWLDGKIVSNTYNQWGPNEPSGDGKCGSLLNAIRWDSNWLGYGWRWNDQSCTSQKGYICQQPLGMSCDSSEVFEHLLKALDFRAFR